MCAYDQFQATLPLLVVQCWQVPKEDLCRLTCMESTGRCMLALTRSCRGGDCAQTLSMSACRLLRVHVWCAGVETIHPVGSMSDYEKEVMNSMMPELIASIEKGVKFVQEN